MIKGKHTRIAGGAKFWSGNTAMVGGLISKPVIINQQNFVSSPSLPSWLTLTRLTAATRFDNTGTLVDVAADTARFDYAYNGTSWANQGLLLEKQSTNLQRNSTGDQLASWTVNSASNTTLAAASTNFAGVSGARISGTSTGTNFSRAILPAKAISVGDVLTISFRASLGTSGNIKCGFGVVGSEGYHLNNGSWTTGSAANYTISNAFGVIENGIARVKYTLNVNTAHAGLPSFVGTNNSGAVYNDIYWVQLENLPYASSFIKTTSAQVTRAQDNLQLNISNYTGSIKLTYKRQDNDATESVWIDLTSATNPILTNSVAVGIWLQNIAVYNRTLTAQEKANA
ncbi:phage head spike fiber domain-containing protein [Acinetobacter soli]|uniref:phage head spike fiber domain-containing protein n=1 Tax=Acinetobacter soli TaxID=487316 RepID=UPI004056FF80